jgi:hypothetical protein
VISAAELVVAVPLINIVPDGPVLDLDAVADVALGVFVEHTLVGLLDFADVEERNETGVLCGTLATAMEKASELPEIMVVPTGASVVNPIAVYFEKDGGRI